MSTPVYIPEEFEQDITPTPPSRSRDIERAKRDLQRYTRHTKIYKRTIAQYQAKERASKDKKKDAWYRKQIAKVKGELASAEKRQGAAQASLYEATGQWEKLLKGGNRDAFLALKSMFTQMGLGSLSGKIFSYVKQGYGADTISLLLQDTKEYKTRFAGNEARLKKGLPVLSPAEYLATESAYRQVLADAGLPKGFYDNPADFTNWISGDVSPTEIKGRVDIAKSWTTQANPAVKGALKQMYGVDESYIVAYALDRKRALPLLEKQAAAAAIGAAALRRGFELSRTEFERYATYGITGEQAEAGFAQIAESYEPLQAIASRFGVDWTQREAEHEVFEPGLTGEWRPFSTETAVEKGKRLRSQERALFSGTAGAARGGLGAAYRAT